MCEVVNGMMACFLGMAAYTDIKRRVISVRLLKLLTVFSVLIVILRQENLWNTLGGMGIGILFLLISKCSREQIGYGDSWLIFVLGIYVGAKNLIWILFAASFGAGIFSMFFCMVHKWNRRYSIPFIPFLAAAFLGVVML